MAVAHCTCGCVIMYVQIFLHMPLLVGWQCEPSEKAWLGLGAGDTAIHYTAVHEIGVVDA